VRPLIPILFDGLHAVPVGIRQIATDRRKPAAALTPRFRELLAARVTMMPRNRDGSDAMPRRPAARPAAAP
jgi:hypothetical protein